MDRRLTQLYNMLPKNGLGIIDVGTDHGLIPLKLVMDGYQGYIFATDIRRGPLEAARRSADRVGETDRIVFQLCDGLELCPHDQIDCILIAGMGGDTICGILDRAEWIMNDNYCLILQPMSRIEVLRYWLVHNEFMITQEEIVHENGHLYQMFMASHGNSPKYRDAEYLVGRITSDRSEYLLSLLVDEQTAQIRKKLSGIMSAEQPEVTDTYSFYSHILEELSEISHGI